MMRSQLTAVLLTVATCLPATVHLAHAQPTAPHKNPSGKALAEARKHFQAAEAAKARGEYQTAAVEYLAAYELFEEPAFFYDTAEVYRLAGDEKNALVYYTKYLELAPEGQGAPAARVAADQLRRSIAAKEDAAKRAAEADAKRQADDARKADASATPKADAAGQHGDAAASSANPGRARNLRIAGMAAGGAGVVALGVGIVFGVKAHSIASDAAKWTTFDSKRDDEGRADSRNMAIFTSIGAAAVITGGVLYYLGYRADHAAQAADTLTIAPQVGPTHVALTAAGRF
jgi:tetratricopeptide (TPR) repeat protein